ncbi:L-aspartate oxidase [Lusitaniella coriacea LEGE 07157]|uniref:L-aspartate oxidase n=1 Tax=Lusitaniella coriacea LEGE 07157 TaxID=945747 RepID=A0A8J7IXQ4_9CYAN|nr:L-aspartate oxidase [Lusitaniella coriacea]MBE9118933.1 L-aspartate oxidase [Lusitaniella coriacea LEGE 07157]
MSPFASDVSLPKQFDVIVVGAGAAGLYAALCLPKSLQVGLITKDSLRTGASDWAQGGIAAAIAPEDSPTFHWEDTIKAGAGLCDRAAVQFLVENAPSAIARLVEMGVAFDRKGEHLAMTLEAAHSYPRVLHAADTTGRAIVSTLTECVLQQENIHILSQALVLNLWLQPQTRRCQGVRLLQRDRAFWVRAGAVVLATGGGGQVFSQTTNPAVSTGDGIALAWRAGAVLRDLEFFQFHPTALTQPGAPRFLISEAVRGEGAHLVDEQGNRFAFEYHPKGELAPRDVVSRAIFDRLEKTGTSCVYLDLSPIEPDRARYRFPNILRVCRRWGIDPLVQPIPVAPAAHYWMGGIAVDLMNRTSIPGLYAIGEVASTGVHGANRLASNSLLECVVYAAQLSDLDLEPDRRIFESPDAIDQAEDYADQAEAMGAIREELKGLMWSCAGIHRSEDLLQGAIARVQSWQKELATLSSTQFLLAPHPTPDCYLSAQGTETNLHVCTETLNLLDVAYQILKSALFRTESRGGHYRSDYPHPSPDWQVHTLIERDRWYVAPLEKD